MPSTPSSAPLADAAGMSSTSVDDPSAGLTRVTRLPVFSVTQRKSSGPQVSSHGSERPPASTLGSTLGTALPGADPLGVGVRITGDWLHAATSRANVSSAPVTVSDRFTGGSFVLSGANLAGQGVIPRGRWPGWVSPKGGAVVTCATEGAQSAQRPKPPSASITRPVMLAASAVSGSATTPAACSAGSPRPSSVDHCARLPTAGRGRQPVSLTRGSSSDSPDSGGRDLVQEAVHPVQLAAVNHRHVEPDDQRLLGARCAEVPLEAGHVVVAVHRTGQGEHQPGELLLHRCDGRVDLVSAPRVHQWVGVSGIRAVQLVDQRPAGRPVRLVPGVDVALGDAGQIGGGAGVEVGAHVLPPWLVCGQRCQPEVGKPIPSEVMETQRLSTTLSALCLPALANTS